jgi:hypothetical protein
MNINDVYSVERIPCKTECEDTTHRQYLLALLLYDVHTNILSDINNRTQLAREDRLSLRI